MPRKQRVSLTDVTEHIILRGNNHQVIFSCEGDMKVYMTWLHQYSKKYKVAIHAWVLMANHVHILCSPSTLSSIPKMMKSLSRMYVTYFNKTYKHSGTIWGGRYHSCLVKNNKYLLALYCHIELDPVKAGMVKDPSEYVWSSYQCNGLGKHSDLLTAHPIYLNINADDTIRRTSYRALFSHHVS